MIIKESDCCDCGVPCTGKSCKYFSITRYVCDECDAEVDELYWWEGWQICADCVLDQLEKVIEND